MERQKPGLLARFHELPARDKRRQFRLGRDPLDDELLRDVLADYQQTGE